MNRMSPLGAALLLALAATPSTVPAAESYDSCTSTIASVPTTISSQGTYCMQADLGTSIATGQAINVTANNVTIQCNGFKLGGLGAGSTTATTGIRTTALNTRITGCTVRGFRKAIDIAGGGGALVDDNMIESNWVIGISLIGNGNVVRGNRFIDNGGIDSTATVVQVNGGSSEIRDNIADGLSTTSGHTNGVTVTASSVVIANNSFRGLVPGGSGEARGVTMVDSTVFLDNNKLESVADTGYVISCATSTTLIRGNHLIGFGGGWVGCSDDGTNILKTYP